MKVHLIDGTYELFRHFYGVPPAATAAGLEVGATRGVLGSVLGMIEGGSTHIGVATDHIIESFRNELYAGYKTGVGIDPVLFGQFGLLEEGLAAMGVTVWAMVEQEADDGLAAAAAVADADPRVEQVFICTPDKDLAQCVKGARVVQFDRRQRILRDEAGVVEKFGVSPRSIPDYLALVGDSADGFPGIAGWGAKSAASVLAVYGCIERIPADATTWSVQVRSRVTLGATLEAHREAAALFKVLATLRTDAAVGSVDEWRWRGPTPAFAVYCERIAAPDLLARAEAIAGARA